MKLVPIKRENNVLQPAQIRKQEPLHIQIFYILHEHSRKKEHSI